MQNIEIRLPSRNQREYATSMRNRQLAKDPYKLWIELITNILKAAKLIYWNIFVANGTMRVEYIQDGPGPTLETMLRNLISLDSVKDDVITILDKPDSSSVFGTGLTTIGQYCKTFTFESHPTNGVSFIYDVLSDSDDAYEYIKPTDTHGVKQTLCFKITNSMHSAKEFIQILRDKIALIDSYNILNGRQHILTVTGLPSLNDDVDMSLPIIATKLQWVDDDGLPQSEATYKGFLDKNGAGCVTHVSVDAITVNDEKSSLGINILAVGKRDADSKYGSFIGDAAQGILLYEETNQLAGTHCLRIKNGEFHANNAVIIGTVKAKEYGLFMVNTEKTNGTCKSLNNGIFSTFRTHLFNTYPSIALKERMIEIFVREMIIYDVLGKLKSDEFRDSLGLSPMNDMEVSIRRGIVHNQFINESGRFDIKIDMIWLTNGTLTEYTPRWCGEIKKDGFKKPDRDQLIIYVIKTHGVIHGVAISNNISDKVKDDFAKYCSTIHIGGKLKVALKFDIVDVHDYLFSDSKITEKYFGKATQQIKKEKLLQTI